MFDDVQYLLVQQTLFVGKLCRIVQIFIKDHEGGLGIIQGDTSERKSLLFDMGLWSTNSWWAAAVANYHPSSKGEHLKSISTGGCNRPDVSSCTWVAKKYHCLLNN